MLSLSEAKLLAESELNRRAALTNEDLAFLPNATIERSFGWVFFYNSRQFIESGEAGSQLAGNAPFIINHENGSVVETGTAHSVQHYLLAYETSLASNAT